MKAAKLVRLLIAWFKFGIVRTGLKFEDTLRECFMIAILFRVNVKFQAEKQTWQPAMTIGRSSTINSLGFDQWAKAANDCAEDHMASRACIKLCALGRA